MAIATMSHNPGFLSNAELRQMFCIRMEEFESIVETLRENTSGSNQHVIVVGPRGSGKTTLLLRVASEIRSASELSSRLYPIVFAEESYGVGTCGEFWLECLSRLAEQVALDLGETALRRTVEEVRKERDDRLLRDRCLGALLHFADREGKRLVLGVENLNMMFSDMMDPDAGWCLRKTLQTEPRIMIVGTGTSRFGEIDRPDRALYDLFRVLTLRPLDREESAVLCERVAGTPVEPKAVRRLHILTGGSPRLLTILAGFGAARCFRGLMSDLLDLVDEHTAYFKSHLESLPAQERRIYLGLAELWKPATAREVAERARMDASKCSAQLRRLMGRGVVEEVGGTKRRKQYYVSERLYNIYYLLRRSRGADGLAQALVEFMDSYYSTPELEKLVDQMAVDAATADFETEPVFRATIEQLSKRSTAAWHLVEKHPGLVADELRQATSDARALFDQASERYASGDDEGALSVLDHLVRDYGSNQATTVRDIVGTALATKGLILAVQARSEVGLAALGEAIRWLESTSIPEGRDSLATALLGRVGCLRSLDRIEAAISACDELISRFPTNDSAAVTESVALALRMRGTMLGELARPEEELESYDELERRFASSHSVPALVSLANGLVNKAGRLVLLDRWKESVTACEELIELFGEDTSNRFYEPLSTGIMIRIAALGALGRIKEQRSAIDQALHWLEGHERFSSERGSPDDPEGEPLALRSICYGLRMLTCINLGDLNSAGRDLRAILEILPNLDSTPPVTIKCLLVASLEFGIDRMATLIRESPSAGRLLPMTTAFEIEMGLAPRVAIEVRQVAQDIQRDLGTLRDKQGDPGAPERVDAQELPVPPPPASEAGRGRFESG